MNIKPNDLISKNYKLVVDGVTLSKSNIKTYSGYTEDGYASITATQSGFTIYINNGREAHYIEPLARFNASSDPNSYIYYTSEDLKEQNGKCGLDEFQKQKDAIDHFLEDSHAVERAGEKGCVTVKLALAATSNMTTAYGSVANVEGKLISVINNVNTDYASVFNNSIKFEIINTNISANSSTTLDNAIGNTTDSNAILNSFRNWSNQGGLGNTPYDIGILFTKNNFAEGVVGLAYLGALCKGDYKYNIIQDFTADQAYIRQTVSHEIGHNFGCIHTTGIMAASASGSSTWDQASINSINTKEASADCNLGSGTLTGSSNAIIPNIPVACKNQVISVSAINSRNATSYNWSAPGSSNLTFSGQNFSTSYSTAGEKNISLTVSGTYLCNGATVSNTSSRAFNVIDSNAPQEANCNTDYDTNTAQNAAGEYGASPTNVTFGSINRDSPTVLVDKLVYENLSCKYFTEVDAGSTVTLSVTKGAMNQVGTYAWIDYNNDGVFDNTTERVMSIKNQNATNTVSVTIPTSSIVANQVLRLRVITDFFTINSACDKSRYGQTEDYGVIIRMPQQALSISAQAVTNATYNQNATATSLSVTAQNGTEPYNYQWYSNTTNSNQNGTVITNATTNQYTPDTSSAGTTYYYCVITDSSSPVAKVTSNVAEVIVSESTQENTSHGVGINTDKPKASLEIHDIDGSGAGKETDLLKLTDLNNEELLNVDDKGKVEVKGSVKLGNTDAACNDAIKGTIRFNGTKFQGCNGTQWVDL